MTDRIIDLAEEPAKVSLRLEQLVVERGDKPEVTAPVSEVAVVILGNKATSITQAALAGLAMANTPLVVCADDHQPVSMSLPLRGHHLQTERFAQQAAASLPTNKRLWRQIIRAKIRNQGKLLRDLRKDDLGLIAMAERVKSGDASNLEAQASRRYWPALFGDKDFRRRREADDQNRFLNYGYAVLRAMVTRALCAAGLHPSIGLHHRNRYNTFPLADDVMEPFRPIVDRAAVLVTEQHGPKAPVDKAVKSEIIGALMGRFEVDGEARALMDTLRRCASSLVKVYAGEAKELLLPDW